MVARVDELLAIQEIERNPLPVLKCDDARESRASRLSSLMTSARASSSARPQVSIGQAILSGWLLCGVLDITAACVQAWIQAGRTPAGVLKGVASALWGRAALD